MRYALFILTVGFLNSCCALTNCDAPLGVILQIELVDSATKEDLFNSGKFNVDSLEVLDENQNQVAFEIRPYSGYNLTRIVIEEFDTGNHSYFISPNSDTEIKVTTGVDITQSKCCDFLYQSSVEIADFEYELSERSGVAYKVLIN